MNDVRKLLYVMYKSRWLEPRPCLWVASTVDSIYFSQACKNDMGCTHKDKFVTWAPPVDINGKTQKNFKDLNFHKVYILHNGLSIVDSGNPNKALMEQDPEHPNYGLNASVMVRKI